MADHVSRLYAAASQDDATRRDGIARLSSSINPAPPPFDILAHPPLVGTPGNNDVSAVSFDLQLPCPRCLGKDVSAVSFDPQLPYLSSPGYSSAVTLPIPPSMHLSFSRPGTATAAATTSTHLPPASPVAIGPCPASNTVVVVHRLGCMPSAVERM